MPWPKGKKQSKDHVEKRSQKVRGIKRSEEFCKEVSKRLKGKPSPLRGRKMSQEQKDLRKGPLNGRWKKDREALNEQKKAGSLWHRLLHRVLSRSGTKKEKSTHEILGYSYKELKSHLESLFEPGMSWENYGHGRDRWNVDHIKPVSSFHPETHPSIVNALSNLKPMWMIENIRKGNRIISSAPSSDAPSP